MRLRLLLPLLALLAAAMAIPGSADAKTRYKVGFGDQNAQIFTDPNFTSLKLKKARLIVPYNYAKDPTTAAEVDQWITRALASRYEVLVAFNSPRGCYVNGKYSKRKACKLPSTKVYSKAIKGFRKQYPKVKNFQPWNEINSKSQPTAKSPKRAAQYYNTLKKACKKCTVVAADLLDSSNVTSYAKRMKRYLKGNPKIWGLHNYSDVNRPKQKGKYTKRLMKLLPGQLWLTETGGLVSFGKNFPRSEKRANTMTKNMFKLANQLSKKKRGYKSRVTRLYPYTFYGGATTERFDAGIVGPAAAPTPRPAYKTFKKLVKKASK